MQTGLLQGIVLSSIQSHQGTAWVGIVNVSHLKYTLLPLLRHVLKSGEAFQSHLLIFQIFGPLLRAQAYFATC